MRISLVLEAGLVNFLHCSGYFCPIRLPSPPPSPCGLHFTMKSVIQFYFGNEK